MPGTPGFISKLTGPGAWSSLSVASNMNRSSPSGPLLAREREADAERPVAVAVGVDRVGEAVRAVVESLGEARAHQRARARESWRSASATTSAPKRATISSTRRTPSLDAAISARMSPHALVGEARIADGRSPAPPR